MDVSTISKQVNWSQLLFDSKDTQTEKIMTMKGDTNLITYRQQLGMTGVTKSIVVAQKVAPINSETPEKEVEERSISPRQKGFNPHLATCAYDSLYCHTVAVLSGPSNCLSSSNPVVVAPSM